MTRYSRQITHLRIQLQTSRRIDNRTMRIPKIITADQLLLTHSQHPRQLALCRTAEHCQDLGQRGGLFRADRQVDHRDVGSRHPDRHPRNLPAQRGQHRRNSLGRTCCRRNDIIKDTATYTLSINLPQKARREKKKGPGVLPSRRFFRLYPSNTDCDLVAACTVVRKPCAIPN